MTTTVPSHLATAPEDPRELVGAAARAAVREARHLQALIGSATAAATTARGDVRTAYENLREQMVRRELADIPVERLRDVTDGRLRLGVLSRYGYRSVLDLLQAGPAGLTAIPGVGPTTATQAIGAARQIAAAVRDGIRVRIDLDPGNQASTALLGALRRYGEVARLHSPVQQAIEQLAGELAQSLPEAATATSRLRMFFAGRRKRQAALEALQRVRQTVAAAQEGGVVESVTNILRAHSATTEPGVLWEEFAERAAEYYGLLGEIVDLGLDAHAAEGFLPEEIVAAVNQQQLDDTYRRVSLRGYQAFGARFALVQRRVILGDEMGLGKTIQAIAAMAHLRALGHTHFLVVCPASVLVNWMREIDQRSLLRSYRLHGPERDANLRRWLRSGDVAVTTFDTLRNLGIPQNLDIGLLVVDEAHYVKNPYAQRTRTLARWTERLERVLFLTGTPMENRLEEFRNLVRHLQPRLAANLDGYQSLAGPRAFRKAVAPAYLRRNQEDVLTELPDLIKVDEWVEFAGKDREAYYAAVAAGNFMAMRRAAFETGEPTQSAKLQRLREILTEAAANGRKVVVFSFFRRVLDIVRAALDQPCVGPLTGSVPAGERQRMVDQFSRADGHAVLLSQIQAGGVGLNIQAASVVVLCEPQVKPTLEHQAIARVHRLGQVRGVQVHRLLVADSVDQRMLEILEQKTQLFNEYARHSDLAAATPDAIDISEVELARKVVEQEQERLAMEAIARQRASTG